MLIAVVALLLTNRGGTPSPSRPVGPLAISGNAVGVIDAAHHRLSAVVALPAAPSAIAAGDGAIWVVEQGGTVTRIDPTTVQTQTIGAGGSPWTIAVGAGVVWVLSSVDETITPINAVTGTVGTPVQLPTDEPVSGFAVGPGAVVVVEQPSSTQPAGATDHLYWIDAATRKISGEATFGSIYDTFVGQQPVAVGEGSVWVTIGSHLVEKISAQTRRVVASIEVPNASLIAVGEGSVWVASGNGAPSNTVYRIDPA